jgi:RNA polymerase sigma-70 factor (ECF subfamily)
VTAPLSLPAETSIAPARDGSDVSLLVARARRGEEAAWEELYRRFAPSVHAILLARLSPPDAEEATQEVFVSAHRRLEQLREAEALGPWLHAMARNAAVDRHRTNRREPRREPLGDHASPHGASDAELRERVLHHIQGLPDAYKETLVLRLVEGLTGPEIAAVTGLTAASVRVNLHRGMELLRPLLMKEGWP